MDKEDMFEAKLARIFEVTQAKGDTALARMLEIKPPSVAAARKRQQIPGAWIEKIAGQFNANANWLLFGVGSMLATEDKKSLTAVSSGETTANPSIPVIGLASCGIEGWYNASPFALDVQLPIKYEGDLLAVIAMGTSMRPAGIRQGYVLFCDPNRKPDIEDAVFIEKNDGTATVKMFLRSEPEWIYLQGWLAPDEEGNQQEYQEQLAQNSIKSIAPVIFVKRK